MSEETMERIGTLIELTGQLGIDALAEHLADACEVEEDTAEDDDIARGWTTLATDLRRVAKRARSLRERAASNARWEAAEPNARLQGDFIGMETTYLGGEWPEMKGHRVRIEGVLPHAGREDGVRIVDNVILRLAGGVSAKDRVEIRPIVEGRASFVRSDPRAIDLECFAALRPRTA